INPSLLPRKERGRPTESQVELLNDSGYAGVALSFGKAAPAFTVPGAEAIALAETVKESSVNNDSSKERKRGISQHPTTAKPCRKSGDTGEVEDASEKDEDMEEFENDGELLPQVSLIVQMADFTVYTKLTVHSEIIGPI
ncbi:unnamed protein product, partial [Echinostoma caproni]|uniref:SDA1 domain-containing protein n=1 Tax=Echinostoma caproni TaxID=27848 RepID=A0A183BGP7_9TREM